MQIPFSVLKGPGGSKAAALLAMLAGLVIVTAMKNAKPATTNARQGPAQARP